MTVDEPGTSTVQTYEELEAIEENQLVDRLAGIEAELKLVIDDKEKFNIFG